MIALSACDAGVAPKSPAVGAAAPPSADNVPAEVRPAPTWQDAAGATYSGLFEDEEITLSDGAWEGAPYEEGGASAPRAGLAEGFALSGDVDSDGADETVVLLWTSGGGSGTFDYLAVLDRGEDGVVTVTGLAPLGDRVKLRKAFIDGGWLVAETVEAGPGDAACCPGDKLRRSFVLQDGELTEVGRMDLGRLSPADLAGDWALVALEPVGAPPADVAITARFEGEQVSGNSGCNRYTGSVVSGEGPGDLTIPGPLAGTRMMCPDAQMEWESRYLQALQGATKYSFSAGDLVLSWTDGESWASLRFQPIAGLAETD